MRDHVTIRIGKGIPGKEQVQVSANLAAVIKDLETPREAATNLEFRRPQGCVTRSNDYGKWNWIR